MCGIAGFLTPQFTSIEVAVKMANCLAHRGPDGEGFAWETLDGTMQTALHPSKESAGTVTPIALAHRRLSIIGLGEEGTQPMARAGRYWITFNGEIYNYVELREELRGLGHSFKGNSDTEVILAAYEQWGTRAFSRLYGMWALAIWDTVQRSLTLCRDRFGIKPLYYWSPPGGGLVFASEIKAFTKFPGWKAKLDHQSAYDFLVWSKSDHTARTFFEGVAQIEAGTFQTFVQKADGSLVLSASERYFQLSGNRFSGTYDDACAEFGDRFSESLRIHLRADVPLGSCLSGGLDSSAIVSVSARLRAEVGALGGNYQTFTAISEDAQLDERDFAQLVAEQSRTKSHLIFPDPAKLWGAMDAMVWHQDEPFATSSIFAQWSVFEAIGREGLKVVLDGQGADELLCGYNEFFGPKLADLVGKGHLRSAYSEWRVIRRIHGYTARFLGMKTLDALLPETIRQGARWCAGQASNQPSWLCPGALKAELVDPMLRYEWRTADLATACLHEVQNTRLPRLLRYEDRDSMAMSVEARVPFLDHRLVEFCLSLPVAYRLERGVTKRVLRDGLRGDLPDAIRTRIGKLGFATAEERWIKQTLRAEFSAEVERAIESSAGILDPHRTRNLLKGAQSPNSLSHRQIWKWISFGRWMEKFGVSI